MYNEKFIIKKAAPLSGTVKVSGSKNAALPILAAALLCEEEIQLENVPNLSDISVMLELLTGLGAKAERNGKNLKICCKSITNNVPDYETTKKIRASFLLAGALLGRFGSCSMPMPGGCGIGLRPVDLHLKGFSAMGAKISL